MAVQQTFSEVMKRTSQAQHPAPPTDWTNSVRNIILSLSILPNAKKEYDGAVGFTLCIVSIGLSKWVCLDLKSPLLLLCYSTQYRTLFICMYF